MKSVSSMKTLTLALGLVLAGSVVGLTGCTSGQKNGSNNGNGSSSSNQSGASGGALESVQHIVDKSSNGQFKAVKLFDGPEGMTGVLVEPNQGGNKLVAWTNKQGSLLMPGPLFDKDGTNLTDKYLNEQAGYLSPSKLADEVVGKGFMAGKSGPIVTVFFEPYCGFCNSLFEKMKPMIDKGDIRARFIMVAFLRPDSAARAADITTAKNPYDALTKWENLKDKSAAPASSASESDKAAIMKNNDLMSSAGQRGTPALLTCNKTTKQVELANGMPPDFNSFVATVGDAGHEACK